MKRIKPREKGFTLVELIFVIAIILVLAGIFLPLAIDKLSESRTARAQGDLDAIAASLTNFFSDLGNFPSCEIVADCSPLSNAENNIRFLAVGTGAGDISAEYPTDIGWSLATQDDASPEYNNAFNHLVVNDPDGGGTPDTATDYRSNKMKQPYISKLGVDPWGNAYIIHVGAMQKNGCPVGSTGVPPACTVPATGTSGWLLSAGPDGNLDTGPTDTVLSLDDIGFIFYTQK